MYLRRNLLAFSLAMIMVQFGTAYAANQTPSYPQNKTANFGNVCSGATHDPHPSSHQPGTINVTSETTCKGKHVSVITKLFLGDNPKTWKFLKQTSAFHLDQAVAQSNIPCIVGKIYRITAISLHEGEWFSGAWTGNSATVVCMKSVKSLNPSAPKK